MERIAADPTTHADLLHEVFERADRDERARLAQRVFDALDPERQWHLLDELFGPEELREYLRDRRAAHHGIVSRARATSRLDTRDLAEGEVLELGLYREDDVRAALTRGHRSTSGARRIVLRALGAGRFQVLADSFNPDGGYFVTRDYDEETWREEKLDSHEVVGVGSISNEKFQPVLHPGARVDIERTEGSVRGMLFLGFAMLSGAGVFAP